jgi:hypothetical protein
MNGELNPSRRRPDARAASLPEELARLTTPVVRGLELAGPESIDALSELIANTDPLAIPVLSKCIPHKAAYGHVMVMGTTDAGKSTTINQVLQDLLWHVGRGYGHRVFIADYKRTARRYLASLPLEAPVYHLDPADARSHGIDWPRELDSDFAAKQFAKLVVHGDADRGGQNYAFTANARSIVYQVIRTFQRFAGGRWDLLDVIEACAKPASLFRVLDRTPGGRAKRQTVFGAKNQAAGVYFTLEEFVSDFGPIAAALSKVKPERRITLQGWLRSESVLVLGHYEGFNEALLPFQRWVFGTLTRQLLSTPDIPHDGKQRTSFVLDEVRNMPFAGRDLAKLMNSGRSKGAVVVAGFGDFAGLTDAVGKAKAEECIGMFKTKVFLRLDGPAAKWASEEYFGKHLRMVRKYAEGESVAEAFGVSDSWELSKNGHSRGTQQTTTTTPSRTINYEPVDRLVVYQGDLQRLPSPRLEGADGLVVRAYMVVEGCAWRECATHMELASFRVDGKEADYRPRPNEDFYTDDLEWTERDLGRLGLVEPPGPEKKPQGAKPDSVFAAMVGAEDEDEDEGPENLLLWFDEGELEAMEEVKGRP